MMRGLSLLGFFVAAFAAASTWNAVVVPRLTAGHALSFSKAAQAANLGPVVTLPPAKVIPAPRKKREHKRKIAAK